MSIHIDRCLCFQVSFKELSEIAKRENISTLPQLQAQVVFGKKCQLCHAYVQRMLVTGETVFHEIITTPS